MPIEYRKSKLKVRLPKDWRIGAAPKEWNQPYALKHITPPEYAEVVSQSDPLTQVDTLRRGHFERLRRKRVVGK